MNALDRQLTKYAAYHRDARNIATHFFGVPMIVVAVVSFLSRPALEVAGVTVSPAWLAVLGAVIFYLRLDWRFGVTMGLLFSAAVAAASVIAAQSTVVWLATSAGLFVVGWVIQFIGHYYEGKKPAFVDDLIGLLIGPLFVTAEVAFALGLRHEVKAEIERVAGPTHVRPLGAASAPRS